MSAPVSADSRLAQPCLAEAKRIGKSSCASLASRAAKRSKTSSWTASGRASGLSTLLTTTMGFRLRRSALAVTNLVCGIGPSAASTSRSTPSTMSRIRSTSPPKSAWPGVSTMLIRTPCQSTEAHLARIVIPRSRSSSLLSITRSATCWFARNRPLWRSRASTRVVLPWSTCAMMAMLRICTSDPLAACLTRAQGALPAPRGGRGPSGWSVRVVGPGGPPGCMSPWVRPKDRGAGPPIRRL